MAKGKTVRKKSNKELKEVVAEVVESVQEQKPKDSIFNKILKYGLAPTVLVALITVAPQMFDKVLAFYNNMSYEDYILAQKQLKYWQEHADCINKNPIVITDGQGEIKLRMCDKALMMAEFEGKNKGKSVYSWLDLNIKELEKGSSLYISLYAQQVNDRGDGKFNIQIQRQPEKLMCKADNENEILYYIKTNDGKCKVKKINKMTGSVETQIVDCKKICKN